MEIKRLIKVHSKPKPVAHCAAYLLSNSLANIRFLIRMSTEKSKMFNIYGHSLSHHVVVTE